MEFVIEPENVEPYNNQFGDQDIFSTLTTDIIVNNIDNLEEIDHDDYEDEYPGGFTEFSEKLDLKKETDFETLFKKVFCYTKINPYVCDTHGISESILREKIINLKMKRDHEQFKSNRNNNTGESKENNYSDLTSDSEWDSDLDSDSENEVRSIRKSTLGETPSVTDKISSPIALPAWALRDPSKERRATADIPIFILRIIPTP